MMSLIPSIIICFTFLDPACICNCRVVPFLWEHLWGAFWYLRWFQDPSGCY
jgi:hypothetical protein